MGRDIVFLAKVFKAVLCISNLYTLFSISALYPVKDHRNITTTVWIVIIKYRVYFVNMYTISSARNSRLQVIKYAWNSFSGINFISCHASATWFHWLVDKVRWCQNRSNHLIQSATSVRIIDKPLAANYCTAICSTSSFGRCKRFF